MLSKLTQRRFLKKLIIVLLSARRMMLFSQSFWRIKFFHLHSLNKFFYKNVREDTIYVKNIHRKKAQITPVVNFVFQPGYFL